MGLCASDEQYGHEVQMNIHGAKPVAIDGANTNPTPNPRDPPGRNDQQQQGNRHPKLPLMAPRMPDKVSSFV
eukprot:jgi/Bigna1/60343/fgenesh1_kg.10_\